LGWFINNYGLEHIADDAFITIVGTVGAISNGVSRNVWATLLDRLPYKYVFGTLLVIQTVIGFTLELIVDSRPLYMIWISIAYFWFGGILSMTPAILSKIYGTTTGSKIYSGIFLSMVPMGFIVVILVRSLYDSIGYGKIFYISASLTIVALILIWFFKQNK